MVMKYFLSTLILAFSLGLGVTHAADDTAAPKKEPSPAQQAQREKMTSCNQEAGGKSLKGDERKAFMKECLSSGNKTPSAEKPAKRAKQDKEKAKACKQEAKEKGLKGDASKAYVSDCLQ
jgi:hypothetical protein